MEEDQLQICGNCNKQFPVDRIDLHEAYCSRNFKKCEKCSVMIDVHYLQDHNKQYHEQKECPYCQMLIISTDNTHNDLCLEMSIKCKFCENNFPRKNLQTHELSCGGQPKPCFQCHKLIPVREYEGHLVRCARRRDRRREREISEEAAIQRNVQRDLQHISTKKILNSYEKSNEKIFIPNKKITSKNTIQPQPYKHFIDTTPISILKAIQQNQKQNLQQKQNILLPTEETD